MFPKLSHLDMIGLRQRFNFPETEHRNFKGKNHGISGGKLKQKESYTQQLLNEESVLDFNSSLENLIIQVHNSFGFVLSKALIKILKVFDSQFAFKSISKELASLIEFIMQGKDTHPKKPSFSQGNSPAKSSKSDENGWRESNEFKEEIFNLAENMENFVRKNLVNLEILFWTLGFKTELWETKRSIYLVTPDEKLKKKLFLMVVDKSIQVSLTSLAKVEIYLHKKFEKKPKKVQGEQLVEELSRSNSVSPKFLHKAAKKTRLRPPSIANFNKFSSQDFASSQKSVGEQSMESDNELKGADNTLQPGEAKTRSPFRKSSGMFEHDIFGHKIEKSYAFKPFTPLVYSVTSNYVIEMLIYTSVKGRGENLRRVSQRPMNLREVVNLENSENKKQVSNDMANKRIYYCDIRNMALMLCDKIKSSNLFTRATGDGKYTGNEMIEVSAIGLASNKGEDYADGH